MSTRAKKPKRTRRKIKYGKVKMTDKEYLQAQNPKIRTTIFLEAKLIRKYKKLAAKQGIKYQQLLRETLWEAIEGASKIEKRLAKLEKTVFKRSG